MPTYFEIYGSLKFPNNMLIFPKEAPKTLLNNTFIPKKINAMTNVNNPPIIPNILVIIGVVTI